MSVSDGVTRTTSLDMDQLQQRQTVFLQIYPRLPQDTAACCTLQVSPRATTATVIQNAGATLGLDMTRHYALLEVRQDGGAERMLRHSEIPVERVLLWPPGARNQHPQEEGYYFILQAQGSGGDLGSGTGGSEVSSLEEYDDLCSLSTLTEDTILAALRQRFYKHNIYTYASGILVAINPFKFLPIYNPKYVKMYNDQPLGKLSPHIFAVADVAFHTMLKQQENQCVVISGESGSGKTQSANFLIHCLTALSQKGYSSGVERTILGAGPVLEAFGNAKTAQNNHSSRFGKFIQVNYLESGVVRGAVVEKYFLEKCRLVFRDRSERNYHVFYYLLVGASKEEQREFSLLHPEDYAYLQQEDFNLEDAEDLRCEFKRLHQAMEMVGFLVPTKKQIFSVLSAILYLGNVTYSQSEDGQGLEAGPADVLYTLSDLLEVKQELLVEALTKRKLMMANNTVVLHYTLDEAVTARDSMAKSLYSSLFDWIVLHINHALLNRRDMEEAVSCLSIGILDIFGFEDFQTNSFEQFCINYSIEKVHYYFHQHVFTLEQEEYQEEGISWSPIDYKDNLGCIHLISQKPTGLFHILDEESNLSQSTDNTLLEKFKQLHHDNPYFVPTTVMEPAFIIQHFTGTIKYQIKDFREKNTDHMRPEIVSLLRSSQRAFMRQLIGSDPVAFFRWGILRSTIHIIAVFKEAGRRRAAAGTLLFKDIYPLSLTCPIRAFQVYLHLSVFSPHRKTKGSKRKQLIPKNLMNSRSLKHIVGLTRHDLTPRSLLHPHPRNQPSSISAQFQASLNQLLETVGRAEPFFIHCIRSNAEKNLYHFNAFTDVTVCVFLQQMRYTGMLETVRIRKSGYNAKFTFKEFQEKFKVLLPKEATSAPKDIANLLQKMGLGQSTYQIGKTKVFLKERERQHLQDTLNKEVMRHIVILQRWFRACLIRRHFLCKKDAAIRIQRCWLAFRADNRCLAATVIQAAWRGSQERTDYLRMRNSVKKMQNFKLQGPDTKAEGEKPATPPQLPPKTQSTHQYQTQHQRNLERTELRRRQHSEEHSPNRSPETGPEVNGQKASQRNTEMEKREGRGSPPPLNRPLSFPLDAKAGRYCMLHSHSSPLSRSPHSSPLTSPLWYPLGHMFSTYQVNIRQSCDLCGFYIWVMEKAYMCSACKLICHKKCLSKIITDCSTRCDDGEPGCLHFGVQVCVLTSKTYPIPMVLLMMLEHVEMNGLYTEGLYRKSGSASHARELHQLLEINPETATLENYSIHTVTGLVKRWFRELPDPLLTYRLYKDFLHAVELPEQSERLRAVYQKLDELPSANFKTLERLVFHLVRVAKEEEHNRMSANSLAIVFAPCILRSQDTTDPFLVMKDVSKTTTCVEILISEQFRRYTEKMKDITELEYAEALAVNQLKLKRQNTVRTVSLHRTPYCCHEVGSTESSIMSLYAVALRFPFTGTKGPKKAFPLLQSPMAASFTPLQLMFGITHDDLRLVCGCSAMEAYFGKLPMNSSCADVASRGKWNSVVSTQWSRSVSLLRPTTLRLSRCCS
uniref:Myosin IXb n=1 Tax=Oncorhynchus tshawytscha TaxID=74940 RepID=A0AAZ3Q5E9_ONCTS